MGWVLPKAATQSLNNSHQVLEWVFKCHMRALLVLGDNWHYLFSSSSFLLEMFQISPHYITVILLYFYCYKRKHWDSWSYIVEKWLLGILKDRNINKAVTAQKRPKEINIFHFEQISLKTLKYSSIMTCEKPLFLRHLSSVFALNYIAAK